MNSIARIKITPEYQGKPVLETGTEGSLGFFEHYEAAIAEVEEQRIHLERTMRMLCANLVIPGASEGIGLALKIAKSALEKSSEAKHG